MHESLTAIVEERAGFSYSCAEKQDAYSGLYGRRMKYRVGEGERGCGNFRAVKCS